MNRIKVPKEQWFNTIYLLMNAFGEAKAGLETDEIIVTEEQYDFLKKEKMTIFI